MTTGNNTQPKKKDLKKVPLKEKTVSTSKKSLKKNQKEDTDFHHEHPFREQ